MLQVPAEVNWLELDRSNKDMEYAQLFEFIVKLATGVYQISPEEVNWQIGGAGQSVTYNSGIGERLSYSQSKGLIPLLSFFSDVVTRSILQPLSLDIVMNFTGLGSGKGELADLRMKEVTLYKTVNEAREEAGFEKIEGGDVVLNPVYVSELNDFRQRKQAAEEERLAKEEETTSGVPLSERKWSPPYVDEDADED